MRRESRSGLWVLACLLVVGALGCAQTVMVRVPLTFAARVPVRVFQAIWIAASPFDEDERIADRLAAHLAEGSARQIRRIDASTLESLRAAGQVPASAAVLWIDLALREGTYEIWDSSPLQGCGYYGCGTFADTYVSEVPELDAALTLTVYEGSTARVLQRERVERRMAGDDIPSLRRDLIAGLTAEAEALTDDLRLTERVFLVRVPELEVVERALRAIEQGDWNGGRRLLEATRRTLGGLGKESQARFWYDLGMARRFAPGKAGLDQAAYDAARRAFAWALRLDPRPEYERATVKLERHYTNAVALAEHARMQALNRAVQAVPVVVAPPDAVVPEGSLPPPPAPAANQHGTPPDAPPR